MYVAQSTIRALHKRIQAATVDIAVFVAGERLSHCKTGTDRAQAMMERYPHTLVGVYAADCTMAALIEDIEASGARVGARQ